MPKVKISYHGTNRLYPCSKCGHKFEVGEALVRMETVLKRAEKELQVQPYKRPSRSMTKNYCLSCYTDAKGQPVYTDPRLEAN